DRELSGIHEEFEFILAPRFVQRRFYKTFAGNLDATFYPFHRPNLLIVGQRSEVEIYATYNEKDHYCVVIACNQKLSNLRKKFKRLVLDMKDYGISYIETLVPLDCHEELCFYLDNGFIPSALYPAMREFSGQTHDYLLLTRTMEPLDFRGINIHHSFRPFINQYTSQWINMHINSIEVYYGSEYRACAQTESAI
ncbi:MAG: hypothetical protein HQK53_08285, partial [Oligoflexia bacterium]|nr:hypothetical protein [Oligoflexia bacterium]